jgi:hypothetical protein
MRAMAWMCITAGANGLIFYSFHDLIRAEDVTPLEVRWRDITQMAQEIKDLAPVLLSVEPALQPTSAPGNKGPIAWRVYGHEGATYLATVNANTTPEQAEFRFPKAIRKVAALLGEAPAPSADGTLRLSYAPLEVKVLKLTPGR